MKTWKRALAAAALVLASRSAGADPTGGVDWDDWYDGEVRIELHLAGGAGRVVGPGEPVRLWFETDAGAYVAVVAIDARGFVRLLYPSFWQDDGWVEADQRVRLYAPDLTAPLAGGRAPGLVYLQAVASPVPIDWEVAGLLAQDGASTWWCDGRPLRIQGDPLAGFNEVNQLLFHGWSESVFAADLTWFHVGARSEHPPYLCGACAGWHCGDHDPWVRVSVEVSWEWVRGARVCHPVWRPLWVYRAERGVRHGGAVGPPPRVRRHVIEAPRTVHRQEHARRTQATTGDRSPSPVVRRIVQEARHGVRSVDLPRRGATPGSRDTVEPRDRSLEAPRSRERAER